MIRENGEIRYTDYPEEHRDGALNGGTCKSHHNCPFALFSRHIVNSPGELTKAVWRDKSAAHARQHLNKSPTLSKRFIGDQKLPFSGFAKEVEKG